MKSLTKLHIVNRLYFGHTPRFTSTTTNRSQGLKPFESIPGPKGLPLIGNIWRYLPIIGDYDVNDLFKNAQFNRSKYGPIVRERVSDKLTIVHLFDPDDIESLFRQDGGHPNRRSFIAMLKYRLDRPERYIDGGIVPENGPRWQRQRSQFQQRMLSKSKVSSYASKIDEVTLVTIEEIKAHLGKELRSSIPDFQTIFNHWSLQCVTSLFLGCDVESLDKAEVKKLMEAIDNTLIATHGTEMASNKWMKYPDKCKYYQLLVKSQDFLHEFAAKQIERLIATYRPDSPGRAMVHDWLFQDNIDQKDVISFVMDAFLGGIHTTGYTLAHMFYNIAKHPEHQRILQAEIDSNHLPKDESITADDVEKLNYLRICLNETLRLYPVSIGTGRLTTCDIELKGFHIPKETMIIAHNQTIGRDNTIFEDAADFIPQRWERYRSCPRHQRPSPFAFRPFGLGARSCIGQRIIELEMKILATRLLQHFTIVDTTEIETRTMVVHTLKGNFGLTLAVR